MSFTTLYSSSALVRGTIRTSAFVLSSFAAVFCASAGYGLLKMLLPAVSGGASIGVAEFSTHGGLTFVFFALAAISAYAAKKCFW